MMNERLRWAKKLSNLINRNSQIAKTYNKMVADIPSESVKEILDKHISRIVQCVKELEQEIDYLEIDELLTKKTIYRSDFKIRSLEFLGATTPVLLRYCIKQKKTTIKLYSKTLSRINEGSTREKLIRHISIFEADLKELRSLEIKMSRRKKRNNSILSG